MEAAGYVPCSQNHLAERRVLSKERSRHKHVPVPVLGSAAPPAQGGLGQLRSLARAVPGAVPGTGLAWAQTEWQ